MIFLECYLRPCNICEESIVMFKGWFTLIVFTLVTSSFAIPVLPHANSKKLVVLAKNVYCFLYSKLI